MMKWLKSPLPLKPLYYVVGSEPFLISEIKKSFIKNVHINGAKDFNHDEMSANQNPVDDLLTLWETLPFMSEKRLIFCFHAEKFSDSDWQKIFCFLSQPIESTILVCFFDKKDGRKKHFKLLKEKAVELLAESPRSWELSPWLDFIAEMEAVQFSQNAKSLFIQLVGTHLMEIQIELKKLRQYMGERNQKVMEKDVLACVSRLKTDSIFDLTSAIGKKDVVQALKSLVQLLDQNQNEIGALAMLARHIRILARLKEGQKQKLSKNQLAVKAGIPPYFLNSYLSQSALWSEKQIDQAISLLFETDKALKSSSLPSHIYLENFVLKTCS